nr:hypothetical protein LKV13_04915 [Borrelia sp. BU AG58]
MKCKNLLKGISEAVQAMSMRAGGFTLVLFLGIVEFVLIPTKNLVDLFSSLFFKLEYFFSMMFLVARRRGNPRKY